jgi:hypothetical protein
MSYEDAATIDRSSSLDIRTSLFSPARLGLSELAPAQVPSNTWVSAPSYMSPSALAEVNFRSSYTVEVHVADIIRLQSGHCRFSSRPQCYQNTRCRSNIGIQLKVSKRT